MKLLNFIFILFILSACTIAPPQKEPSPNMLEVASFCNVDADCTCGGIDKQTDNCFVGNKLYASKYVDFSRSCPDFCTGIAANFETKCVEHVCKNVRREMKACTEEAKVCPDGSAVGRTGPNCEFAPCPEEPVLCTQDVKECPDGSFVARVAPSCDFAPCPSADLSNAHWLCEDSSWKKAPEDCFVNTCVLKSDCQLMGVKGPCGSYLIAGPTSTLHKPPIFYADKCGGEYCEIMKAECIAPDQQPRITGFDCVEGKCVVRLA